MRYIALATLKNTTGIVTTCKGAKEPVLANKNGGPKLVLIRTFNNPAEMVRICEAVKGQIVPVLRNGVDKLHVMNYEIYKMRKDYLMKLVIK